MKINSITSIFFIIIFIFIHSFIFQETEKPHRTFCLSGTISLSIWQPRSLISVFMFCCKSLSRLLEFTDDKFTMGYVLSKVLWFWTPADYDVPDNTTGLTPREKDIIQRTWKLVRADLKGNGIKLFLK